MQPIRYLISWLEQNANSERYLFTLCNMRVLLPDLSEAALKTLFSRATKAGHLIRICRGLYACRKAIPPTGLLLFHAAAQLRASEFNYISLETVLSDAGVISQVPINWITIMTSGRSNVISCGDFGTIEFIHTTRTPTQAVDDLTYDADCRLWRASVPLALKDMKATRRDMDLIDWEVVNEFL